MVAKKKIVFLTDCLAGLQGGAERQIYELATRVDQSRYECFIASLECTGSVPSNLLGNIGARLVTFPVKRIYGLSGIREGFRFFAFLKREKIDILLTYHFSSDIWGAFWAHVAGVKAIVSNRRDMGFWRGQQHVRAYRLLNHWVTRIIVVANAVKDMVVREEEYPAERVEVIYNGIVVDVQNAKTVPARQQLGLKEDELVIIQVGGLRPVKGHEFLLRAIAQIGADVPRFRLVLIGDGELRHNLENLVKELHIEDRVAFLGNRPDARQLLEVADICVLPSLSEGMSNAILEYMAAGKPVVATRVGGNPELVTDGLEGILVDKENVVQLKDAIVSLLQDPAKRKNMRDLGRAKIHEQFRMEKMIGKYEKLFNELTG